MSARDVAVATITREHRALGVVVEMLQRLLADVGRGYGEPDFALFAAALYYIDDFPERCHHPKEDEFLFKALRARTAACNATLDALQAEHVRDARMVDYLHRALVHYQGGAPGGFERFKEAVDAYAGMLRDHMHTEEELLARAGELLAPEDWEGIAAAFDANDDPIFGANQREEFRRLYLHIVSSLPSKMRLGLLRRERASPAASR